MDIFDTKTSATETTPGPHITAEVHISPESVIELYDFGAGVGIRVGEFYYSNLYIALGWDAETRRNACERLIAVLYAAREWKPTEPDPEPEPSTEAVPA